MLLRRRLWLLRLRQLLLQLLGTGSHTRRNVLFRFRIRFCERRGRLARRWCRSSAVHWRRLHCSDARRCQRYGVRRKHQLRSWQRGCTQLPSSVGYESKCWLWFYSVLSLAQALPEVSIQTVALPQGSLQTGAQSAVLRHAVGGGGAPRFRLHRPLGCLANAPFAKWSLRPSFTGNSSLVDGGTGGNLTRGRRPLSR